MTTSEKSWSIGLIIQDPRSVAVNHAGLWIRRHQFESGRGYLVGTQFFYTIMNEKSACRNG